MATQTVTVDSDSVTEFVDEFAAHITVQMARDSDVVLSNDIMEGTNIVAIESWDAVQETIFDALLIWIVDIQNRAALRIPIPQNFYAWVYLLVERSCKDSRGVVRFPLDISDKVSYNNAYQNALFGKRGYFANKWRMYNGVEYLSNGLPVAPTLALSREGNLSGKDQPVIVNHKPLNVGRVPVETHHDLFISLDGFDPDSFEMYKLLPPADVKQADFLQGRLHRQVIDTADFRVSRAALAAVWAYQEVPPFVRVFLPMESEIQVMTDILSGTLVLAEQDSSSSDMPAELPLFPPRIRVYEALLALFGFMNPMLLAVVDSKASNLLTDYCKFYNSLASVARDTLVPTAISESFRAHKYRFLTYGKTFSGTIYAFCDQQPIAKPPTAATSRILGTLAIMKSVYASISTIETAPLVSLDFNRIAITAKYCLRVHGKTGGDDNTTETLASQISSRLQATALFRLAQRMGVYYVDGGDSTVIDNYAKVFFDDADSKLSDFKAAFKKAWVSYFDTGASAPIDQVDVLANAELHELQNVMNQYFPLTTHYDGIWYDFTKFEEKDLIAVAGIVCNSLVFPTLDVSGTNPKHLLIKTGYRKLGPMRKKPQLSICGASLVERTTRRPRTEQGYVLKHLARLGGFGFGALLGPLVGQLGGLIGNAVGVPEIGQIASTVGNFGGGILDAII